MRNVSDKFVEKNKTPILCSNLFSDIRAVYEIVWKSVAQTHMPSTTIQCCVGKMSFVCRDNKGYIHTLEIHNTHCLPRQQLFSELALVSRYTHVACLVCVSRRCVNVIRTRHNVTSDVRCLSSNDQAWNS